MEHQSMKNWWVSWYASKDPFEWNGPWWVSGVRLSDDASTIVAAVRAQTEEAAKLAIVKAHDKPVTLEWRFCGAPEAEEEGP